MLRLVSGMSGPFNQFNITTVASVLHGGFSYSSFVLVWFNGGNFLGLRKSRASNLISPLIITYHLLILAFACVAMLSNC